MLTDYLASDRHWHILLHTTRQVVKCPERQKHMLTKGIHLQANNAPTHSLQVVIKVRQYDYEIMQHPPVLP